MAKRCGFVIENGKVNKVLVDIDWELGFDSDAKLEYIFRMYSKLQALGYKNVLDVTTANTTPQRGNELSPHLMGQKGSRVVELFRQACKENEIDGAAKVLYFDWFYIKSLNEKLLNKIACYDCFIDVFHKPGGVYATQAKSCALAKLLIEQSKLDIVDNVVEFYNWRMAVTQLES